MSDKDHGGAGNKLDHGLDDTDGHAVKWSDQNLNQAITQVESALTTLRQVGSDDDDDTEGQGYKWSDENLKQGVKSMAGALGSLKAIQTRCRS